MNIKKISISLFNLLPSQLRIPFEYEYKKKYGMLEKEFMYLDDLQYSSYVRAIDIGANKGIYSYHLSQRFNNVESFEPQFWCTKLLKKYATKFRKNIKIHNCGLSNENGKLFLNIPLISGRFRTKLSTGLASFNKQESNCRQIEVPVYCLDEFDFTDIGFIKIDVEGHESEVIEGAKTTIEREKPIMLVEVEQRHLKGMSITTVFKQIQNLGYEGKFLQGEKWIDIKKFSYEKHQKNHESNVFNKKYINNFLFLPS